MSNSILAFEGQTFRQGIVKLTRRLKRVWPCVGIIFATSDEKTVTQSRWRFARAMPNASLIAAAVLSGSCPAVGNELMGYKGDCLKGSVSCVHPNIIHDLIERVNEAQNYIYVLRVYLQQGYCLEADIPTILVKPLANHAFRTWDGHKAEIWETVLRFDRGDGTSDALRSFSIVFPLEMEWSFSD